MNYILPFVCYVATPCMLACAVLYIQRLCVRASYPVWTVESVVTEQVSDEEYNALFNSK